MEAKTEKPKVYPWFIAYCILMCLMFSLVILMGITGQLGMHIIYVQIASGLLVAHLMPVILIFLKPTPLVWLYDLVLICLGMVNCCSLPITIPLLVFWVNQKTKSYFGQ